jgi:hypothetical protein
LDIYGSNLTIRRKFLKNESIEDMKCCVRQDGSWRRINKDLATMDHASEKSKRESWHWGTVRDRETQVDVQSEESSYPWRFTYHQVSISIESRHEVTWRSNVQNWLYDVKYSKPQPLESQCQSKIKCGNPHKVKEKWSGKNQHCASSSWINVLYVYLEYRNATLSSGISHGLPTKSQCSHSPKTPVRWVKHNDLIHSTSHQTLEKL